MARRAFVMLLAVIMLLSAMPFALAEGDCDENAAKPRVSAYCPVCGLRFCYRYYNVTRSGSGLICCIEETYEQPYCNQHGNVYRAQLATSHEFYHDWVTDCLTGKPKCRECGEYGQVRSADIDCDAAPTVHRWATNYASGRAECSLCDLIDVGTLTEEDMVCPNHKTFHNWVTNNVTGNPMCDTCGQEIKVGIEY